MSDPAATPKPENPDPATTGRDRRPSSCSPLRVTFSREEIVLKMRAWMSVEFGEPGDYINAPDQREKWYRDYGMLYHFICDHFPAANNEGSRAEGVG
jgi:hypothetical protein